MKPQLKIGQDGRRTLHVFYTSTCWDEAIEVAEKHFDLVGDHTITVICFPASMAPGRVRSLASGLSRPRWKLGVSDALPE